MAGSEQSKREETMSAKEKINSINRTARVAGFLYLLVVPLGVFSIIYVPSRLIVPGDAATTANNIMASEWLFRLGIVSNLLASVIMLLVVLALYKLLSSVNKSIAWLMVIFVLVAVPIAMLSELTYLAALQLMGGANYLALYTREQLQALAFLFLRLHGLGVAIAFIFWGLWLAPLGYLVFRSGFLPRILGVFLMIACLGYLIDSFATFLGYSTDIGMFTGWGELLFLLWLLIKGVDVEKWKKRALAST